MGWEKESYFVQNEPTTNAAEQPKPTLKWEYIGDDTYRMPVPGGWLYRFGATRATMAFVPVSPLPLAGLPYPTVNPPYIATPFPIGPTYVPPTYSPNPGWSNTPFTVTCGPPTNEPGK